MKFTLPYKVSESVQCNRSIDILVPTLRTGNEKSVGAADHFGFVVGFFFFFLGHFIIFHKKAYLGLLGRRKGTTDKHWIYPET